MFANITQAERADIIDKITSNGGQYSGDLEKNTTTHLIAKTASGRKHDVAPRWGIHVVAIEWLSESIERGMVLDESLYDVKMNPMERGKDAWIRGYVPKPSSLGKRRRGDEATLEAPGKRILRRTVSAKLSNHQDAIWADIGAITSKNQLEVGWVGDFHAEPIQDEPHRHDENEPQPLESVRTMEAERPKSRPQSSHKKFPLPTNGGKVLEGTSFYIHDFHPAKVLFSPL